jgi:hypothetical protein
MKTTTALSTEAWTLGDRTQAGRQVRRTAISGRQLYLQLLTWCFTLFSTARLFCYLPTMMAIHANGDSSQHSLWTWLTWLGANATMAAWLYEKDGQRVSSAMWVNCGNGLMCAATVALIVAYRI